MSNFHEYAKYYDLLNKDKNYELEATYIDSLIKKYSFDAHSVLELGSGTGIHAMNLSRLGYDILGVDLSSEMVEISKKKINDQENVNYVQGDIRNLNLNRSFEVIISLFHVMSYQTNNNTLKQVFQGVKKHLKKDGIFLFDFWYGPAVLSTLPETRLRKVETDSIEMSRIAEPTLYHDKNTVDVKYNFIVRDRQTDRVIFFEETHSMRYFFIPELENYLAEAGLEIVDFFQFNSLSSPELDSWNVLMVARSV